MATQGKPASKTLKTRAATRAAMGHNRRISPFDREDLHAWGKSRGMDPLEKLATEWLSDAKALRRAENNEMARVLEQHASGLKKAYQESFRLLRK